MTDTGNFTPAQLRCVTASVSRLEEVETQQRALDAERITILADVLRTVEGESASGARELRYRSLRLELASALSRGESAIERLLNLASSLSSHYAPTLEEVKEGRISLEHARVVSDAGSIFMTGDLSADAARRRAYESEVLVHARQETPTRLRPIAQTLAARYAEHTLEEQHREAATRRCVRLRDLDSGMAELVAFIPAVEAHAIYDRVTRIARATVQEEAASRTSGPSDTDKAPELAPRSRDAVRADVLRDLLLTGTTDDVSATGPGVHAKVQVIVPVSMLHPDTQDPEGHPSPAARFTALGRRPTTVLPSPVAELVGYGPIPTSEATRIAHSTPVWEGVFTGPDGDVLAVNRYTPTPEMQRRITARDLHCRAPGCRAPAHRCDIDHTTAASDGGPTTTANLALLCRAHHTLKHHSDWHLTQHPGGVLEWTSPTGRVSIDRPPSRVRFSTDPAPPRRDRQKRSPQPQPPPGGPDNSHPF